MLLMYRPVQKDIAVDIYATNTSTSGHTRTSMVTGVNLDDTVTYSVQYRTVTATVNGVIKSFPIDSPWGGSLMYFKLGRTTLLRTSGTRRATRPRCPSRRLPSATEGGRGRGLTPLAATPRILGT